MALKSRRALSAGEISINTVPVLGPSEWAWLLQWISNSIANVFTGCQPLSGALKDVVLMFPSLHVHRVQTRVVYERSGLRLFKPHQVRSRRQCLRIRSLRCSNTAPGDSSRLFAPASP